MEQIYDYRLLYVSVGLRTRQDTISYSFIYIVQKKRGPGNRDWDRGTGKLRNRGPWNRNRGLQNWDRGTRKPGTVELGNRETGDWDCKTGTVELGLGNRDWDCKTGTVELGNRGP